MSIKSDTEAFYFVANSLIQQGARSMRENEECAYRGHSEELKEKVIKSFKEDLNIDEDDWFEGNYDWDSYYQYYSMTDFKADLKCAVGHLIDDNNYSLDMEGKAICAEEDLVIDAIKASNKDWEITLKSISMLKRLQSIHDSSTPSRWESELKKLCFNLDGSFDENETEKYQRG